LGHLNKEFNNLSITRRGVLQWQDHHL